MLWWLGESFLTATALAAIAWLICRVKSIPPAVRHAFWLLVLVKLLTPPLFAWPWALHIPFVETQSNSVAVAPAHADSFSKCATAVPLSTPDESHQTSTSDADDSTFLPSTIDAYPPVVQMLPTTRPAISTTTTGIPSPAVSNRPDSWQAWRPLTLRLGIGLWLLGGCIVALVDVTRIVRMQRRIRRGPSVIGPQLAPRVSDVARRLGVRVPPIRVIDGIASPAIWAIWRPMLLWPAQLQLDGLGERALAGLLVHELAHIRRRDHWVGWLELLGQCLWWWNPLFWYVRHQLRENAELACDAWVVELYPAGRRAYAEALLAVCENAIGRFVCPTPAVGAWRDGRRLLERRLTMILQAHSRVRLGRLAWIAVAIVALVAIPAWSQRRTTAGSSGGESAAPVTQNYTEALPGTADRAPNEARELLMEFERQQAADRAEMEQKVAQQREQLVARLEELLKKAEASGQSDEAASIRQIIARFRPPGAPLSDPGDLMQYRDRIGQTFCFQVTGHLTAAYGHPAIQNYQLEAPGSGGATNLGLAESSIIWGDGIYTDDSPLAMTAIHAGLLKDGETGILCVQVLPGQDRYNGAERNGITSQTYGPWQGSYVYIGKIERPQPLLHAYGKVNPSSTRLLQQKSELEVALRRASESFGPDHPSIKALKAQIDAIEREIRGIGTTPPQSALPDPGALTTYRGQNGRQLTFDVVGSDQGTIWGDGVYTDDSAVATVAVHAGLLKVGERGFVTVTLEPGRDSYPGSTKNGITSQPYGAWDGSYEIKAAEPRSTGEIPR